MNTLIQDIQVGHGDLVRFDMGSGHLIVEAYGNVASTSLNAAEAARLAELLMAYVGLRKCVEHGIK